MKLCTNWAPKTYATLLHHIRDDGDIAEADCRNIVK